MLFLLLHQVFVFLHELAELEVLVEVVCLVLLALQVSDLEVNALDLFFVGLFFFALILDLLVALLDFRLELGDLFDLVVGHSESGSVVRGLIVNLTDQLLALLDELLLALITGSERLVYFLVLVFKFLQVFAL